MYTTPDIMNALLARYATPRYLEIGVCTGDTFFEVQATHKVGVDPAFQFDTATRQAEHPHEEFFSMTSDDFFERLALQKNYICWDLVYIDGYHTYVQAWQDFLHVLPYTHENTIIVFDDTIPGDPYSSLSSPQAAAAFRSRARLTHHSWHGDVYKCLFHLHDYAKNFSYGTIVDCDNPRTVVWRASESVRTSVTHDPSQIHMFSYFDLFLNGHVICPMTLETCLGVIGKSLVPQDHFTIEEVMNACIRPFVA